MFYTTYKTTNLVNGHFYIGRHATDNLDDGYLGSGTRLRDAIRKYGREKFKKEIIGFYENEWEMNDAEAALITPELIADPRCYNLTGGGAGMIREYRGTPKRRRFADPNGFILEGRIVDIAYHTRIPAKKLSDRLAGRRSVYRGYRAA